MSFAQDKPFRDQAGVTSVPAGRSARVATIGRLRFGDIPLFSSPRRSRQVHPVPASQARRIQGTPHAEKPGRKAEYFEVPLVMKSIYPWWYKPGESGGSAGVSRPSAVAGTNYEAVSKAYAHALHSVLTRESTAPAAAAALENELVQIMGSDGAQPGTGSH